MHTALDYETSNLDNSEWILIYRLPCSESTLYNDLNTDICLDSFIQILLELGLHEEQQKRIEMTLVETVNHARVNFYRARLNIPIDIHLYCQRRTQKPGLLNDTSANLSSGISITTLQEFLELNISFDNPKGYLNGGWGYFMIERGNDLASASRINSHCIIELYLYKEGC